MLLRTHCLKDLLPLLLMLPVLLLMLPVLLLMLLCDSTLAPPRVHPPTRCACPFAAWLLGCATERSGAEARDGVVIIKTSAASLAQLETLRVRVHSVSVPWSRNRGRSGKMDTVSFQLGLGESFQAIVGGSTKKKSHFLAPALPHSPCARAALLSAVQHAQANMGRLCE